MYHQITMTLFYLFGGYLIVSVVFGDFFGSSDSDDSWSNDSEECLHLKQQILDSGNELKRTEDKMQSLYNIAVDPFVSDREAISVVDKRNAMVPQYRAESDDTMSLLKEYSSNNCKKIDVLVREVNSRVQYVEFSIKYTSSQTQTGYPTPAIPRVPRFRGRR